ncbi:unnamed protein product [Brassica oleracea]|uniref:(rape) hypothetical protein n=1 Tax=Brassica napus TaxID=3708 RepID=A0A816IY57_BRANA|nr:unnamed protein product [Brassica napus]
MYGYRRCTPIFIVHTYNSPATSNTGVHHHNYPNGHQPTHPHVHPHQTTSNSPQPPLLPLKCPRLGHIFKVHKSLYMYIP